MPNSMPIVAPVDMSSLNLHNVADPAATSDASTMRRLGSYQNTDNSVVITTEVVLGSFTAAIVSGRRYRLSIHGSLNVAEDNATVGWFQCRYASGTVTNTSTQLLVVEQTNSHGWNQACAGWRELIGGTDIAAGTYHFGLTVARAAGSSTVKYGGGNVQPNVIDLYDIGT